MADEVVGEQLDAVVEESAPKPRRRRRTKAEIEATRASDDAVVAEMVRELASSNEMNIIEIPKRRRGRPRKSETVPQEAKSSVSEDESDSKSKAKPKSATRRVRKTKAKDEVSEKETPDTSTADAMTQMTLAATVASVEPLGAPATTIAEADQRLSETGGVANALRQRSAVSASGMQTGSVRKRSKQNRRNRRQDTPVEPSLTREELEEMKVAELRAKAIELGLNPAGVLKRDLVGLVYDAAARAEGFRPIEGVLDIQNDGYAILRTGNYMCGDHDAFVHQQLIRSYGLRPGDWVSGSVGPARSGNKYPPLQRIDAVNGRPPENLRARPRFRDLTPIFPDVRLTMEHGKDSITGRAIDLVAPIGKGQRGLIVSPPKAGKTTVLKHICQSITANNPEVHLFCLLVDERPEEVTDMERSIRGTVVASTFDMPADNHTKVAELVIEHAKRLVEVGEDVVVVLDSITRLARAYNLAAPASGRILSGGVDSAALYPPKKFLGAARNIENGGSLTILASALVDTGSKMDEVIFEEFKGTGNMELKLDRDLANRRIFPAIDPVASGTRNEDLLVSADLQPFVWGIRRVLANMNNTERAAKALVDGLKATTTNEEFLIRSAKKAQQQDFVA